MYYFNRKGLFAIFVYIMMFLTCKFKQIDKNNNEKERI